MKRPVLALFLVLAAHEAHSQAFKTLPKGVRMFAYRNVTTSKITANYNQSQAESPISHDINANAKTLEDVGTAAQFYFQELKAVNPAAYEAFSLGRFNLSAQAQVNVHGFGGGYGITDRLTVYGILPYYRARVQMKYQQVSGSNLNQVADSIYNSGQGDIDTTLANITAAIPAATGNMLQSVVVNTYNYDELGNWEGQGYGDMELGSIYQLIDHGYWGLAFISGVVAPTGRVDDPDILQDIGFGDGQWDAFAELGTGYVFNDTWQVNSFLRYTYQMPGQRRLRIPTESGMLMSDTTGNFTVKFGDRIDWTLSTTYSLSDWISFTPGYEFGYQASATYDSPYGEANTWLAENSDRLSHVAKMTASVSSITPFLKKEFLLPATLNFNVQQTVAGKNVPIMTRFEVELRMLF